MSPAGSESAGEVTRLLRASAAGSQEAARDLMPLVHAELRALAASYMRGERRGHTLQPTALVNEAFVRLLQGERAEIESRRHFFALAARAMRHVLVDHARERAAEKRGGGQSPLVLDETRGIAGPGSPDVDAIAVHEALEQLEVIHERQARVVEMRFFAGLTIPEIAAALGVSTVTIDNDWAAARAWLFRRLSGA